ncbi:PQQ-dependent sugar dehydrogenase [bacterium]|nr:MAG: PQQ-dependent sugar dehydrogenase [bacterium]
MNNTKTFAIVTAFVGLIAAGLIYFNRQSIYEYIFKPTETTLPALNVNEENEQVVAENLAIPWEIAFLPDGTMLVTERIGKLKHIKTKTTVIDIAGVAHRGEGGLLGMALHPNFKNNRFIYLYSTTTSRNGLTNRVERYQYANDQLTDRKVIIEGIPGSNNHDGGRIAFGPDGLLYIGTGDAQMADNAQDKNSLAGKILRITDEGSIPSDNPFGNAVYSYGHRNVQGLAWDASGQLWATEHGPSGGSTGYDELNKIQKGNNYGWPNIKGDETEAGMVNPIVHSGSEETWAPSGLAHYKGWLIFSGLRGQSLYATKISNGKLGQLNNYLREKYGRLRAVVTGPDGFLYVSTSNTDGRGSKKPNDDKIIKINWKD